MSNMQFVEVPKVPKKVRAMRWMGEQTALKYDKLKTLFEDTSWEICFSVGEQTTYTANGEKVMGKILCIATQHGGVTVPPGSWIVVGEDGALTTRFDDQFRAEYVAA